MDRLLKYGKNIISKYNLDDMRESGIINGEINDIIIDILKRKSIKYNNIEINKITRIIENNNMKGHIDHCQVIKMNNSPVENTERYIHLGNKYYLYKSKHIDYTLVVYENDEFTGGDLVFADGYTVKAIKNTYIFFNTREYHTVEQVKGKRISSVYSIILL